VASTTFSNPLPLLLTISGGAVVLETGDSWRDTFVATLRGDGEKLPGLFITQTSYNASYASGRRVAKPATPTKGMNIDKMKEYVDMISNHVHMPSILIMDRLSSHTSPQVLQHIKTKVFHDGTEKLKVLLLPAKTSFLISPCDNSFFSAFKTHFSTLNRCTLALKREACDSAYQSVTRTSVANLFRHCGIVTSETIEQIEARLAKGMTCVLSDKDHEYKDFFDSWKSGTLENASLPPPPRRVEDDLYIPDDSLLDGDYYM